MHLPTDPTISLNKLLVDSKGLVRTLYKFGKISSCINDVTHYVSRLLSYWWHVHSCHWSHDPTHVSGINESTKMAVDRSMLRVV